MLFGRRKRDTVILYTEDHIVTLMRYAHIHCVAFAVFAEAVFYDIPCHFLHGETGQICAAAVDAFADAKRLDLFRDFHDPAHVPEDGRPHVGIENVRRRLEQVCGGTLIIRSAPGEGTAATIRLPREGQAA